MEIALSSKLKLSFVDGTCVKPVSTSPLFLHWIRCNNMVTSWLLNSISVEIRNSVVYMKSAMDIWIDLATRYAQSNVPKLFQLRSEISHLTQGNLSIAGYFAKFRAVNDELECMVTKPRCTCTLCKCTVNVNLDAYEQDVKLSQFLMGLSEQFTGIRGHILMMKPLPSLSQCYSLLLQEENQRSVALSSSVVPESVAMSVKTTGTRYQAGKGVRRNAQENKDQVLCEFCHMQGHTKEKCYCLHGYPSWHRLFGKPKPKPRFMSNNSNNKAISAALVSNTEVLQTATQEQPAVSNFSDNLDLTDSQCKQLLMYLQKSLSTSDTESQVNTWFPSMNSSQFAGSNLAEGSRDW